MTACGPCRMTSAWTWRGWCLSWPEPAARGRARPPPGGGAGGRPGAAGGGRPLGGGAVVGAGLGEIFQERRQEREVAAGRGRRAADVEHHIAIGVDRFRRLGDIERRGV